MKVGQVVHQYLPHSGGIENYVYRLKTFLESKGHTVNIYTTDASFMTSDNKPAFDRNGIIRDNGVIYCKSTFSILRNPLPLKLLGILNQSADDIYHIHSPWYLSSLVGTLRLRKRPKVMTVHSAEVHTIDFNTRVLNWAYHPIAQYIMSHMNALIPLSTKERDLLLSSFNLHPEKVITIPNGIDLNKFNRDDQAITDLLAKYNLKQDTFKVLFVSRLVKQKNPDKLIAAVTKYIKRQDIEVLLIGKGTNDDVDRLRSISDERIHILGEVTFKELVAAYYASDLFVFLGLWEGLPTVILEAMACGLPVLTTPVAGIPDLVTEGENGLYISVPIDEEELANKIIRFIEEIDKTIMSKANIQKIQRNYAWESIGAKFLEIYEQVLSGR